MADPHGDMHVFPPSSDWTISITVQADPLIRLDLSTSDGMDDLLIPTSNSLLLFYSSIFLIIDYRK